MKLPFCILLFSFTVFAQDALKNSDLSASPHYHIDSPDHVCGSPMFTEEFISNNRERMRTLYPDEYQRMLMPKTLNKTYKVGMTEKFWVTVDDTTDPGQTKDVEITAQLLAKGNKAAIWADVNEISVNNNINNDLAIEYLSFLESATPSTSLDSTKGAYEIVKSYFGNEPNKDGDGITDFLFYEMFSGAAGYFSSGDQGNSAGSNQRDILYIDSRVSIAFATSTIAHEFQHLLHYSYTNKGRKFNEGMSEVASVITGTGYPGFNPNSYLTRAGNTGWSFELTGEHYSMGGLFVLYFAEQLGYASLLKFQEIDASDLSAFQRLLNIYNTGKSVKSWFQQWHIANYLNNKSISPLYGYDYDRVGRSNPNSRHTTGQVESTDNTILNYDANYISFTASADSLPITFNTVGSLEPTVSAIQFTDDSVKIKNVDMSTEYLVTDANSKVNEAVFVVSNLHSVSTGYNYKSEGENTGGWFEQNEISYDDGEVDVFNQSGGGAFGYLGCGGDPGCGWGVAFDPKVGENQLVSVSINMGFAQDFSSGAGIPASADKDFDLHIWQVVDDNGGVLDVIPPIKIDGKERGINGIGWVNIDLLDYAQDLTNLGEIIIGVVDDDTLGVYFGMSSDSRQNSYTYNFNNGRVSSIDNFQVGGDPLDGWNFMFRSTWLVKNTTVPNLHAGFMQHSVFNDQLKIYVLGNSVFNSEELNVYLTSENEVSFLNTSPLVSNDSILISDFKLKNSGNLDIRVAGSYLYSNSRFDTTFNYNVGYTDLTKPIAVSSRDSKYKLTIPENGFDQSTYVVVGRNSYLNRQELMSDDVVSDIYSSGFTGMKLNAPAFLEFIVEDADNSVSIGYFDGRKWYELQSFISSNNNSIYAYTSFLGHFALIKKGSSSPLSIDEAVAIPTEYALGQNYPNPFNPDTRISYDIIHNEKVSLVVYDILGRKIVDLVNEIKAPGRYNVMWNGNDANGNPVGSGMYLYQLKTRSFSKTKKMVISR